jgi:hypothetical protein
VTSEQRTAEDAMSERDESGTVTTATTATMERVEATPEHVSPVLAWLRSEFPEWDLRIERTTTVDGHERPLYVATREGHHPQSELSPAKLHSRLADYLDREDRRNPSRN